MSRTPTIVVNRNTPLVVEMFSRIGTVVPLDTAEVTRETVRDADILIVRSETRVDRRLLEGSRVRLVGTVTIGTDHIDLKYLAANGIGFASAPGSNANSVAEYVAAALLVWSERRGSPLNGKTIGIVGVGNVGTRVVHVAKAFGMNVLLNDPPRARSSNDMEFLPLDELMGADILTLHVPLTRSGPDSTYHFFDEARLCRMKRGSVLINTSRGAVVDTGALSALLSSQHLSAAIIDVWEGEPEIDLTLLENVLLGTPHIAGYSLDGKVNALRMVYSEVCRYLGVPAEQDVWPALSGDVSPITIPSSMEKEQDAARLAVRQAYDIELDDALLRKLTTLPVSDRGRYFRTLRAEYRVRREFSHWRAALSPRQSGCGALLKNLGFKTFVREGDR